MYLTISNRTGIHNQKFLIKLELLVNEFFYEHQQKQKLGV